MPKRFAIQDEYEHCEPTVFLGDAGKYLRLSYSADINSHRNLGLLDNEINISIDKFNKDHAPEKLKCERHDLEQIDDKNYLAFDIFAIDAKGAKSPMKTVHLSNLAYILAAHGRIPSDASVYIRGVSSGAIEPQPEPPPITFTQVATVGPQLVSNTSAASAQMALPSLKGHYFMTLPFAASATSRLNLKYVLNDTLFAQGATPNPTINADYGVLKGAIEQTVLDYNRANNTQIAATVTFPTSRPKIRSEFDVFFSKPPARTRLSLQDMHGVADALELSGCLTAAEAQDFKTKAAAQVPLLQLTGPATSSPMNAGPAPVAAPAPLLNIRSCYMVIGRNPQSQRNTLKIDYTFAAPTSAIQNQYAIFKAALENAAKAVPMPHGTRLEANVGYNTMTAPSGQPRGMMQGSFTVEFERMMHNSRQNIQEQDMRGLIAELSRAGCVIPSRVPGLQTQIDTAVKQGGWSMTP